MSHAVIKVCVYGSLRKGFHNYRRLEGSICEGTQKLPGYKMFSLGAFPGILPATPEDFIHTEVYSVTPQTLMSLDSLEGHPRFYKREQVDTLYGRAWIYVLQNPDGRYSDLPEVPGGEWGAERNVL
jgi:gamma-glutamylcyclotransferase (GGCT)/AIG2-like uncharacterized protein YtfP